MNTNAIIGLTVAVCLHLAACSNRESAPNGLARPVAAAPDPLLIVLAPHGGDRPADRRIAELQQRIAAASADDGDRTALLERLGRMFVQKARTDSDAGCYELARHCALAIEAIAGEDPAALLLRGHVLHQQHEFAGALAIATRLVELRGTFLDRGLLGDVQLDLGRTDEAVRSYQAMLDEKPCLQSYARAAKVRWRVGDVEGARRLLDLAMHAGSPRDPEALAWVHADRSRLELEAGAVDAAALAAQAALQVLPDYPPALLASGRVHLARSEAAAAVTELQKAADLRPEPDYLWTLHEALVVARRLDEAKQVADQLARTGGSEDARTFALYLASAGGDSERAVQLARAELQRRQDVYTYDALAWALHSNGRHQEAEAMAREAMREGNPDPRLCYRSGAIAKAAGSLEDARLWLNRADACRAALLPSERAALAAELQRL